MSELFDKSIRTLELPRVLQLLSEQAVSTEAKERALRLYPETETEEVLRLLDQTDAARYMIGLHGAPSLSVGVSVIFILLDYFKFSRYKHKIIIRKSRKCSIYVSIRPGGKQNETLLERNSGEIAGRNKCKKLFFTAHQIWKHPPQRPGSLCQLRTFLHLILLKALIFKAFSFCPYVDGECGSSSVTACSSCVQARRS